MLNEAQLKIRSKGVGGSEAPAIMGLSPYESAHSVWERKVGLAEVKPETHHMERGNFLEPGLRAWASKRLGASFEESTTLVHPEHPLVLATPDGVWRDGDRIVEVLELKAPGPRTWHEWGEGEDEAPLRYVLQVAQEMAVSGARRGRIGALIDGDLRIYTIHRDQALEQELIGQVEDWWARYVDTRTPPPVDGSKASGEWLKRRFPGGDKTMVDQTPELIELVQRLAQADAAYGDVEKALELVTQQIKERLGEAYGVSVPGVGKVTWGTTKGRSSIDWQAIAKHLGATEEHEAQFLKQGAPFRTFRFTPAKKGK